MLNVGLGVCCPSPLYRVTPVMAGEGRGGTLRIGMTGGYSYTGGQPDQGFEGFRFIEYQLYDPWCAGICRREQLPPSCLAWRSPGVSKDDNAK
jgi:hypothetical protein